MCFPEALERDGMRAAGFLPSLCVKPFLVNCFSCFLAAAATGAACCPPPCFFTPFLVRLVLFLSCSFFFEPAIFFHPFLVRLAPFSFFFRDFFVSAEERGGVLRGRGLRAVPGTGDVLLSGDHLVGLLDAAAGGGGRGHPQVPHRLPPRSLQGTELDYSSLSLAVLLFHIIVALSLSLFLSILPIYLDPPPLLSLSFSPKYRVPRNPCVDLCFVCMRARLIFLFYCNVGRGCGCRKCLALPLACM